MQLLLGVFFFSVLLATGSALTCEICTSQGSDCTGHTQECNFDNAVCMTLTTELGPQKITTTAKSCNTKDACKGLEDLKGKAITQQTSTVPVGAIIKQAICSKAPPSFASFFPAVLGLLLVKLLF
ncbi:phospholipase A2 inhibitor and Ly6/PLAUR domain-containing protein-like [Notechis scutatus]|uniref:Phospholipase A2 inhibitor and Ly6/PLAUR domain-containing protein-like n=1 Tax=Notechis scutatus TaxID=8663 RepID=A0A6J1W0A0_9SAUR|nr:phospholipase A2 inhibitor and Ly6/PLAUR domain-containing protein-like [Notechis scutatus]XP_026546305.1 phospholipase A2 inhibitor and Ly6/PLAUR domain-containing protein-like [Notechis scutatus]